MRFHRPRPLMTRATVSVVVPCYNYGHYLPNAVASVLDQDGVDVEVIIVDDASPDGSVEVAHRLAAADPRVQVVAHETNLGHIATYNDGLARVTGEYVVLLSADDALVPRSLSRAVALMQAYPRVGLVYGYSAPVTHGSPVVSGRVRSWTTWDGRAWLAQRCRTATNPISTPEVVMRRQAWEEIGGYDARVPHAADMLVWFSTALRWDIGRVNRSAQALYRVHGENMHLTVYAGMVRDLMEQRRVFSILFSQCRPTPPDAERLEAAARRAMARRALRLAAAERRTGRNPELVAEYEAYAAATVPDGPAPGRWRAQLTGDRVLESRPAAPVRRVQVHLAWRRWRRYGI